MRSLIVAVLTLLALSAPAAALPPGFEDETLVDGLTQPVTAAFVPDGRLLVLEKPGRVKVVPPGSDTATEILNVESTVNSWHDRGALGLAVDGQFAQHPYVYVLSTFEVDPANPDANGAMTGRMTRYRLTPDSRMVEPKVILGAAGTSPCARPAVNTVDCIPSDADTHSIGTVRAAPDGTLYVGAGDGWYYDKSYPESLRTYDENSLSGKIMRVDREGRGVAGHPFCPTNANLAQNCTKLFAKGFRNPFRFSLRPGGGLSLGDVGWGTVDELDLVPAGGGRSYGWPCYEGPYKPGGYQDLQGCKDVYDDTPPSQTAPDDFWFHEPDVGGAAMGGPEYTGTSYPAEYRGKVFYGDYAQGWIEWRDPAATGDGTRFREGNQGVVELTTDPVGDLVQVSVGDFTDGAGSVSAIRYCGATNCPPTPYIGATPTNGTAPLDVTFDARASTDPEGTPLTYAWDFGDGTTAAGAQPAHRFADGTWTVRLTVTDGGGATRSTTTLITAGNSAPTATASGPPTFRAGVPVSLRGSATDPQDGALAGSRLSWRIVLIHGGHQHLLGDRTGTAPTFTPLTDHDADSYYLVTLTARDSGGLTGTASLRIDPETVPLTIASDPPGAPLSYAGVTYTQPYSAAAAIGFATEVTAAPSFTRDGVEYTFARWSDGGARQHGLTIPDAPLSLVATYATPVPEPSPDPSPEPSPVAPPPDPAPSASPPATDPSPDPSTSPSPDPEPTQDAPTAYLGTGRVDLDKRRRGDVYLTCKFFDSGDCSGVALLQFKGERIARAPFTARVDRSRRVQLRLNRAGFRKVKRRGRLRVDFVVRLRGAETVRARVQIRP